MYRAKGKNKNSSEGAGIFAPRKQKWRMGLNYNCSFIRKRRGTSAWQQNIVHSLSLYRKYRHVLAWSWDLLNSYCFDVTKLYRTLSESVVRGVYLCLCHCGEECYEICCASGLNSVLSGVLRLEFTSPIYVGVCCPPQGIIWGFLVIYRKYFSGLVIVSEVGYVAVVVCLFISELLNGLLCLTFNAEENRDSLCCVLSEYFSCPSREARRRRV